MLASPLISVVMPAYNAGAFIRESIDSILNQSMQDFELLIINDGSSDDTEAVVQSFQSGKIAYRAQPENRGVPATRNALLGMARGEYIAFADSDDVYHPRRLEIQADFLRAHPAVGVVSARIMGFNGTPPAFPDLQPVKARLNPKQIRSRLLFSDSAVMAHPLVMLRKSVLREHSIAYSAKYPVGEDFHLYQQLGRVTDMVELDAVLCLYRVHAGNISKDRKITRKHSIQARIDCLKSDFNLDIGDIFDDDGRVKSADAFARLTSDIDKLVDAKSIDPRYDTKMLRKGAVKFLYAKLRDIENRTGDYGAIYAAYRQSKLLRRISFNRKLRIYLKALLAFFTRGFSRAHTTS